MAGMGVLAGIALGKEDINASHRESEILSEAQAKYEEGRLNSKKMNDHWFIVGFDAYALQQVVVVDGHPREAWTLLAGTQEKSMFAWLEDEWEVSASSISNACSQIGFYHATLGFQMKELQKIGRARLSAALSWMRTTYRNERTDQILLEMLRDKESVALIRQYVAEKKAELSRELERIERVGMGKAGTVTVNPNAPSPRDYKADDDYENIDGEYDWSDDAPDSQSELGGQDVLDAVGEIVDGLTEKTDMQHIAEVEAKTQPVRLSLWGGGQSLSEYILSVLADASSKEEIAAAVQSHFGGGLVRPLVFWDNELAFPAGLVVVSPDLDEETADRVNRFLEKRIPRAD